MTSIRTVLEEKIKDQAIIDNIIAKVNGFCHDHFQLSTIKKYNKNLSNINIEDFKVDNECSLLIVNIVSGIYVGITDLSPLIIVYVSVGSFIRYKVVYDGDRLKETNDINGDRPYLWF